MEQDIIRLMELTRIQMDCLKKSMYDGNTEQLEKTIETSESYRISINGMHLEDIDPVYKDEYVFLKNFDEHKEDFRISCKMIKSSNYIQQARNSLELRNMTRTIDVVVTGGWYKSINDLLDKAETELESITTDQERIKKGINSKMTDISDMRFELDYC